MSTDIFTARQEIHGTLSLCDFCTSKIAISFIDDLPTTSKDKLKINAWFIISVTALAGLVTTEFAFVINVLITSSSVAAFVTSLHIVGYGSMSLCKCLLLWFKRPLFRKVVNELVELWPVSSEDNDALHLKRRSLNALRFGQLCYMVWNILGVCFYDVTPIARYLYHRSRGAPADLGYIWHALYPFDKTKPVLHEFVYVFEGFAGMVSVWSQLGSDLIFTTMSSNISMLLRLLQLRIRNLANSNKKPVPQTNDNERLDDNIDCYDEVIAVIKIHQRLVSYSKDLEEVFSLVNLINVLLSSVNICCVVFNIVLLEPWMDISNKLFLGATLSQVGILCWYADDIFRASVGVSEAVYESGWYKTNARCRRALLLLLQRSQKPLYFTALKFRNITMTTYRSIITTSYSYFTLLYTMYKE